MFKFIGRSLYCLSPRIRSKVVVAMMVFSIPLALLSFISLCYGVGYPARDFQCFAYRNPCGDDTYGVFICKAYITFIGFWLIMHVVLFILIIQLLYIALDHLNACSDDLEKEMIEEDHRAIIVQCD